MVSVQVSIPIEDPDVSIADGYTVIRLYRAATPDATFSTQVGSDITLVSGTYVYTVTDASGTNASWYRYTLYGTTPGASAFSPAFRPDLTTLLKIMQEANRQAAGGWTSTCSADGTTGYLVDAVLADTARDTSFAEGLYIYRPDAVLAADKLRRVAHRGYTVATFRLAPSRAWTNLPANGEAYTLFYYLPPQDHPGEPYSWARAVADGLNSFCYPDLVNLGLGDGQKRRFDLSSLAITSEEIGTVYRRRITDSTTDPVQYMDRDAQKNGRWVEIEQNGPQALAVIVRPAPSSDEYVVVEAVRSYSIPYGDTDVTDCPLELAVAATRWAVFRHLNSYLRPGKYAIEEQRAWDDACFEAGKVGAQPASRVYGA